MKKISFFLLICLLLYGVVCGSETEGHHHFSWADFIGRILNSLILFGGLYYLLRKPAGKFLQAKSEGIKDDIEKRRQKIAQNEQELVKLQKRIEKLQEEIEEFITDAEKRAGMEKEEILKNADQEGERIKNLVREMVANELQQYLKNLKTTVIDEALRRFKETEIQKLSPDDHLKLIDKNIEECLKIKDV